ncbi:hypothetical protein [Pannonibacter tanglangensis]|uniref:hypothetical protein n=1 Tax=Pannonibacter tanglangensis TaxID=2750084 RepID=UPI001AD92C90|nr:hypothetical protein [Pannonibacter sp. XCT-34]
MTLTIVPPPKRPPQGQPEGADAGLAPVTGRRAVRLRALTGLAGLGLALLGLSACSRPTGDFDRARPSVTHDVLMPEAGKLVARLREEPVSEFILTDDEKLLRDLGWGLIRPPATQDWIGGTKVELTRTRLLPEKEGLVPVTLYTVFLGSETFRSSNVRFDRIAADARGDATLVPPFCAVATRVAEADLERLRALSSRDLVTTETYAGANARVWENRAYTDWVAQALRFRIQAYQTAVDHFEIETPSGNRVWEANRAIKELETVVRLTEKGCQDTNRFPTAQQTDRSRIYGNWGLERPAPQK